MKTTTLVSTIILATAVLSGCERREEVGPEPNVEAQRAEREAFTAKARERLNQLDARINQLEQNTQQHLRQLTQQAKVAVDEDDKRDIQDREAKLREEWNDDLADVKRERDELKADIDNLEMKAYENWSDAKNETNEAFEKIEKNVDELGEDIQTKATKAVDEMREEMREKKKEAQEGAKDVEERGKGILEREPQEPRDMPE